MKRNITKAVIAAAGYGTRFLPATKNQPKEMLPIIDKPIIHYLVEEAVNSGIKDIIIVSRHGNGIMEDYFDNHYEIEDKLKKTGKLERLQIVQEIPQLANFVYVRQKKNLPYGNATPLISVKPLIDNDEAFVYMFGDDLTIANTPVTKQLINTYQNGDCSAVLGVQEVPWDEINRYASIEYKDNDVEYSMKMGHEKLESDKAPSNMAQFGRFVMSYDVLDLIEESMTGKDGELWVIDILNKLVENNKRVLAKPIEGEWLTTGDPIRYLKTTLKFALERDDLKSDLREYIKQLKI
jgi:UTP--glucose-1-phosphate uridylyltransferase